MKAVGIPTAFFRIENYNKYRLNMQYFKDHKDFRDALSSKLMSGKLEYKFQNPDIKFDYDGKTIRPKFLKRNSIEARIRIFADGVRPIELSYCALDSLASLYNSEMEYVKELKHVKNIEDNWSKVEPFVGKLVSDLYAEIGVHSYSNIRKKVYVLTKEEYVKDSNKFDAILDMLNEYAHVKKLVEEYSTLDIDAFNNLDMMSKSAYFYVKAIMSDTEDRSSDAYRVLDQAFHDASRTFRVDIPVLDTVWSATVPMLLSLLEKYGITRFYMTGNSSLFCDNLWEYLSRGWKPAPVTLQRHYYDEDKEVVKVIELSL